MASVLATSDFELRQEPKFASSVTNPVVAVKQNERLEILGADIAESVGAIQLLWVKVRAIGGGEGFANRLMLSDAAAPDPVADDQLEPQFRRTIELTSLATLCYRNALRSGTNAAILLALAFSETGVEWTDTIARPSVGERIGIFGFTQAEWNAALTGIGPEVAVMPDHLPRARAQCSVAGVVLGRAWNDIAAARGGEVRAVDLYLAFIASPQVAVRLANADPAAAVSTILAQPELDAVAMRVKGLPDGVTISAGMTAGDLTKVLASRFDVSLDFVRNFSQGLVAAHVPAPTEPLVTTRDEMDLEDPADGEDDAGAGGVVIEPPVVTPPVVQPTDGTLLVSEAHLVGLWRRSFFPIDGRGIILFGIRGCLPVDIATCMDFAPSHKVRIVPLDYRKMRCTIGQWRPGAGFALFPGSTVPHMELIDDAANRGGAGVNQMGRGRYRNYKPHWHKRRQGPGGHWALVQESDVSFQRTAGDSQYTPSDPWDTGRPGDNIHCASGMGPASDPANGSYNSAGCQVIAGRVSPGVRESERGPWSQFIAAFKGQNVQSGAEYVLFDGAELETMVRTQSAGKTHVLRMGSEGPLVGQLQAALGLSDPDDKFGKNTFKAVIRFQHARFGKGPDDGIVGPTTAAGLGMTLPPFDFSATTIPTGTGGATGASGGGRAVGGGSVAEGTGAGPAGNLLTKAMFEAFVGRPGSGQRRAIYDTYINYFISRDCQKVLDDFGVSASRNRLAHFFAQAAHETGNFTLLRESLTYTTVRAVRRAWESRASNFSDAFIEQNLLGKPTALGDWAYGDRMGNIAPGDGFKYRGGGVIQTTGRSAYRDKGRLAQVDLENNPELIERPEISMLAACAEWKSFNGNGLADAGAIRKISRAINRGDANSSHAAIGEDERLELFRKLSPIMG